METTISENKTGRKYIAFFDLDRTIIKAVSGSALARGSYRRGLMSYRQLIKAIWLSSLHKLNLRDPVKIMDELVGWVGGLPSEDFADLCTEIFRKELWPAVYEEAVSEIEMHKKNNASTVMLSSTVIQICKEFKNHLGLDDHVCSELETHGGYLTGSPKGKLCYGGQKAIRLREYCEKNNSKIEDAWYYGDSISDLPALAIVGTPVCINPDKKLLRSAIGKNWRICNWKTLRT